MKCVETSSYFVAVNGNLFGFFEGKCGVRQGDPLSPYLFIVCMKYLSWMLNVASQKDDFHFNPKCSSLGLSHFAFADDILLLCRCDLPSMNILFKQLLVFGRMSKLVINANKSSIFFSGVGEAAKHDILQHKGFCEGSFPFKYLGMPLSPHMLLASQFYPLLHKLEACIRSWMGKHMSYTSRFELIHSVLSGMI
jgi:hypothetical protein